MKEIRKKINVLFIIAGIIAVGVLLRQSNDEKNSNTKKETISTESQGIVVNKPISVDIENYYIRNTGDPSNLYYIDGDEVLWSCGRNDYGQLGNGTQDFEFHTEWEKVAENVIHVDFSQRGFTIFLTKDHELYGMGNASSGALQQYEEIDNLQFVNGEKYTVNTPCLLMENVIYARCGRDDIACLTESGEVWIWGTIGYISDSSIESPYFECKPIKVLDDAVFITGGIYNHAALLSDGSVWTWGYNYSGNCGVEKKAIVTRPEKVAEDVIMVWTGSTKYNIDCTDIAEFEGEYERMLENTIIQKRDGSYWICGANVGIKEKILPVYYEVIDYSMICTHEFLPYDEEILQ